MEDKRIKLAGSEGQEYAHIYEKQEDYKYNNEDQRVTYHVDSDLEEPASIDKLYNLNSQTTTEPTTNRIKTRINVEQTLEDHRQRVYKVRNKAPIYDKSDPGIESYQLEQDPRQLEVQNIKETSDNTASDIAEEATRDRTKVKDRYVTFVKDEPTTEIDIVFVEGSKVKHTQEKISGTIRFVGPEKIAVVWEDNTRERFSVADAKKELEVVKSYVDTTQQQVDPLDTTPFPKSEEVTKEVDEMFNKALAALDGEDDDLIEDRNPNKPKIDIERAKLERQVKTLKSQLHSGTVDKVKQQAALELIDLMQLKGILSKTAEATANQKAIIMSMNDTQYEELKEKVIAGSFDAMDLILLGLDEEEEDDGLIEDGAEFAKMKEAMKKATKSTKTVNGIEMGDTTFLEGMSLANFKGTIGDFTGLTATASGSQAPRSVKRTDNEIRIPAMASKETGLDFSGFQNLEGPSKPLNIPGKQVTARGKYSDLLGDLNWTTISKIH